jgi:DNA-binding MarR family transcriptional regulator
MNVSDDDSPNLLGALALLVTGRMRAAVAVPAGAGGALAEALVVVKDHPGVTAEWLARVLQLSQPGAAHLVRRLQELGWVERRPGVDARSRALHLTRTGRRAAEQVLQARHQALADALRPLSRRQRAELADIARTLLRPRATDDQALAQLCRLCDRGRCEGCPVYAGYLDHHRPDQDEPRRRRRIVPAPTAAATATRASTNQRRLPAGLGGDGRWRAEAAKAPSASARYA